MSQKSVYADNRLHLDNPHDAWTKLFNLVPEKTKVLDIGCSSGNFGAELIKQKKCTVIGVDINDSDIALAKKRLTKAVVRDIERETLDDLGKFDVVVMADVIEHLIDPVAVLQKLRKLLNKNGVFIFSVPNMANMATRLELLAGRFEYTEFGLLDETHLHYYDRVELEKVLQRAGFSVTKYDTTIRDIPESVVKDHLKKMGLQASPRFFKLVNHPDARAFQFIGSAKPSATKTAKFANIKSKTPYDFMSQFIDDLVKRDRETLELVRKQLQAVESERDHAEQAKNKLQKELDDIHNSRAWKLVKTMRKAKGRASRLGK